LFSLPLGEFVYSSPVLRSSRDLVRNVISYARTGGTAQVAADPASRATYGDLQKSVTNLVNDSDVAVKALATRELALRKDSERRFESLIFEPFMQPDSKLIEQACWHAARSEMWDLVRLVMHPYGAAWTIDQEAYVTGISHTIVPPNIWRIKYQFQSATVWRSVANSRFSNLDNFDTAVFAW
jgi:hypothetical protein